MGNGKTIQTNLGRITHTSFGNENPFNIIFEGLEGNKTRKAFNYFYHFSNVKMIDYPVKTSNAIENEKLIYGEIYKSKLFAEHDVLDIDNLTYSTETQDELYAKNAFIIFRDLSIVFTSSVKFYDDQFIAWIPGF